MRTDCSGLSRTGAKSVEIANNGTRITTTGASYARSRTKSHRFTVFVHGGAVTETRPGLMVHERLDVYRGDQRNNRQPSVRIFLEIPYASVARISLTYLIVVRYVQYIFRIGPCLPGRVIISDTLTPEQLDFSPVLEVLF